MSFPIERVQTPTYADMYCAGFISKTLLPNANYVAGGLQTPNTTKFVTGDIIYLAGGGYTHRRPVFDPPRTQRPEPLRESSRTGQRCSRNWPALWRDRPRQDRRYTRNKMAIGQIEYSCDPVNPGDIAVPFAEKPSVSFHPPARFDRFVPKTGKTSGRIVLGKDFDLDPRHRHEGLHEPWREPGREGRRLLPCGA